MKSIKKQLDESLVKHHKENPYQKFPLRPSSAGYCSKRLGFDLAGYLGKMEVKPEVKAPNVIRLLSLGHSIEYAVFQNFKVSPITVAYQQQVVTFMKLEPEEAPLIEGSVDGVFIWDDYKAVVDCKSAKDSWSSSYRSRFDETQDWIRSIPGVEEIYDGEFYVNDMETFVEAIRGDFLFDNIAQLNVYLGAGFFQTRGITEGVILKYCKNDSEIYLIRFPFSQALFDEVKNKFQDVYTKVTQDKIHELKCDYPLGSIICAFCPYKDQCRGEDALKSWLNNEYPNKKWPTKSSKSENHKMLEHLFNEFSQCENSLEYKKELEEKISQLCEKEQINKIELDNGDVYELKLLKSPRPHISIRKGKK
jgi:hypothetical protein